MTKARSSPIAGMAIAAAIVAGWLAASPATAQEYPAKPIRMINGFAAGGNADLVARIVWQKVSEAVGQPVVYESKPGAGTLIANAFVAGAEPDGYTLLVASSAFATAAGPCSSVVKRPTLSAVRMRSTTEASEWLARLVR